MYTFIGGLLVLLAGYVFFSRYVEKQLDVDENAKTPAYKSGDGVDFIPMPTWKVYLIQFLNIAGLGPIFGALMGALYGPIAFLWVVVGCVLGGAVHDYVSGMISLRHNGASLSEIYGMYLGKKVQNIMRVITVFFCVIVGVVFVAGPAGLLNSLIPTKFGINLWIAIIFIYYFLATILPVDVIIGKIYPIFGMCLAFMAVGVGVSLILNGYHIPEIQFANLHPKNASMWPMMFVTIACGAISGFHATQSPMMARCLKNEKDGRKVFYGAMITEGVVAMVWVAAGLAFYKGTPGLAEIVLGKAGSAGAVFEISNTLLGKAGGMLAIMGVIVCPITTGDTAFRSARLALTDILNYSQEKVSNRLAVAVPMFVVGVFLTFVKFPILWRYMGWLTQAFAMVTLWASSVYFYQKGKNHWLTSISALFMTCVSVSYIMQAPEGFKLPPSISNISGVCVALVFLIMFFVKMNKTSNIAENIVN